MSPPRFSASIAIYAGTFASQPLAFACLLDAADRSGAFLDLDDVDVIREAAHVRLSHYFRPELVARLEALRGEDDTLILVKPRATGELPVTTLRDPRLRPLGLFEGELVRAGGGHWA